MKKLARKALLISCMMELKWVMNKEVASRGQTEMRRYTLASDGPG